MRFIITLICGICLLVVTMFAGAGHHFVRDYEFESPHVKHSMIPKRRKMLMRHDHYRDQLTLNKRKFSKAVEHDNVMFKDKVFDSIEAYGDVDVYVVAGRNHSGVRYVNEDKKNGPLYVNLKGKTLTVCRGPACLYHNVCARCKSCDFKTARARVYINMKDLTRFKFAGKGQVTASGIGTKKLDIDVTNCGVTRLSGKAVHLRHARTDGTGEVIVSSAVTPQLDVDVEGGSHLTIRGISNLRDLDYKGHGSLNMYWLNSCHLHVKGHGSAEAFLAGVADEVYVDLENDAYLNSRFLRGNVEYINTQNTSRADVWAKEALNALAVDFSNIYYYHDSKYVGSYMKQQGSVLRMVGADYFHCHGHPGLYRKRMCPMGSVYKLAGK